MRDEKEERKKLGTCMYTCQEIKGRRLILIFHLFNWLSWRCEENTKSKAYNIIYM